MRRLLGGIVGALLCVCPAAAHGAIFLAADATGDKGYIRLTAVGSTDLRDLRFGELRGGSFTPVASAANLTPFDNDGNLGEIGAATADRASTWRCDRRTRTFAVYATNPEGGEESASFTVRTPSCKHRFTVDAPIKIKPERTAKVFVRDSFELGDARVRVCRTAPGSLSICRPLRFSTGQVVGRSLFTVSRKGRWRLTIKAPAQQIKRTISVGVKPRPQDLATLPTLVTTGDSLMQGPDALLEDKLGDRAVVHSDVYVGSGLTKPFIVDWTKIPAKQVGKFDPDAVMLFLGANDAGPITPAGGEPIGCCDDAWIAEYVNQARITMQRYVKAGTQVFWLNIPLPRDPRRQVNAIAVNKALPAAAAGLPEVHIVDIASVFTPNDTYRDSMTYAGRTVDVRQPDGLHLSVAGSNITDRILIAELERFGVLPDRAKVRR